MPEEPASQPPLPLTPHYPHPLWHLHWDSKYEILKSTTFTHIFSKKVLRLEVSMKDPSLETEGTASREEC